MHTVDEEEFRMVASIMKIENEADNLAQLRKWMEEVGSAKVLEIIIRLYSTSIME